MFVCMPTSTTSLSAIRNLFLEYFQKQDHAIVPSSSLVPDNDPTLLFTNAGMVQFKDYFTGKKPAPFPRATTAQKCVRAGGKHNDLENVGYTARHHTFFEMLGNFSFGDYFKEMAIYHAWTLVTKELELSPDKLCVTVFHEDDEAFNLWKKITGFPDSKIIRIASSDNFWSMGDTGPCGPCSEIFVDRGEHIPGGPPGSADEDGDRFTEIWNLVFMQYEQKADGSRIALPRPCIDTGMGLERVAAILQNKNSNFEIDLFQDLIAEIRAKTNVRIGHDQSCNVIADHIRSIGFLIADGVLPLNEGRGYVLRRIIRRAIRHARVLGTTEPILFALVDKLVQLMGAQYPELKQHESLIKSALLEEEKRFGETLDFGLKLVDESVANLSGNVLPGEIAFKLYDTYGFPIDLTADVLRAKNITIDVEGFERAMQRQKEMSKRNDNLGIKVSTASAVSVQTLEDQNIPGTVKKCYETTTLPQAHLLLIAPTDSEHGVVVLDQTPFFAESGGQVGDTGTLLHPNGNTLPITHTYNLTNGSKTWILHEYCGDISGFSRGDTVEARVDAKRRKQIAAHHSATHILQAALRNVLGPHVTQKGSLVNEQRLRFDFTHSKELSADEKERVEALVNETLLAAQPTHTEICSKDEAVANGALAFFDEKYGEQVRLVQIGPSEDQKFFSQELCGGTHVTNTGQIGSFHILSESGIAAGVRRIEALCGEAFRTWSAHAITELHSEIEQNKTDNKRLQKRITQLEAANASKQADISEVACGDYTVTIHQLANLPASQTRTIAEELTQNLEHGVCIVTSEEHEQVLFVLCVGSKDAVKVSARTLVQGVCQQFNGRGGGKPTIAQCGGIAADQKAAVLSYLQEQIKQVR